MRGFFFRFVSDGMYVLELEEKRLAVTPVTVTDAAEVKCANEPCTVADTVKDKAVDNGIGGVVTNADNTLPIGDRGGSEVGDDACQESQDVTDTSPSGNARGYLDDKDKDWDPGKGARYGAGRFVLPWMDVLCLYWSHFFLSTGPPQDVRSQGKGREKRQIQCHGP